MHWRADPHPDPPDCPPFNVFTEARGLLDGVEQLLGRSEFRWLGSNLAWTVDFPMASNALKTLELYSSNKLVATFPDLLDCTVLVRMDSAAEAPTGGASSSFLLPHPDGGGGEVISPRFYEIFRIYMFR